MNNKYYYLVSEVSEKLNLPASLIRFWEKEFDINIKKSSSGYRMFSLENIETLRLIKYLLKDKKYTIKGAKDYLANKSMPLLSDDKQSIIDKLTDIRGFLVELLSSMESKE